MVRSDDPKAPSTDVRCKENVIERVELLNCDVNQGAGLERAARENYGERMWRKTPKELEDSSTHASGFDLAFAHGSGTG